MALSLHALAICVLCSQRQALKVGLLWPLVSAASPAPGAETTQCLCMGGIATVHRHGRPEASAACRRFSFGFRGPASARPCRNDARECRARVQAKATPKGAPAPAAAAARSQR